LWFVVPPRTPQTFAHLNLSISFDTRAAGGQVQTVKLPLAEDALRLTLFLPEPGGRYRVQWEDVKGPLDDLEIEKQDANSVSVIIPANKLTRGQYSLKLFRREPDGIERRVPGNYYFNVE
jgi:hypothetical protein